MDYKNIASYKSTKEIIEKYDFYIKKSYGQNFLVDDHVVSKIINGAQLGAEDLVIEIGPGLGGLTQVLSGFCKKVICIEIDKKLIPILDDVLGGYDNVEIINEDILKIDLDALLKANKGYKNIRVVANLPYYITTPIIMFFLECETKVDSLTIMMQKEVANRLKAGPKTKDYGSLTIAVSYYANISLVANVPRNCFIPRPNVDSAVLHLDILKEPPIDPKPMDEALMFRVIKASFAHRRKTLVNSISSDDSLGIKKDELIEIIATLDWSEKVRGEELNLSQYVSLANAIKEINKKSITYCINE